jgi:hypothetical protein
VGVRRRLPRRTRRGREARQPPRVRRRRRPRCTPRPNRPAPLAALRRRRGAACTRRRSRRMSYRPMLRLTLRCGAPCPRAHGSAHRLVNRARRDRRRCRVPARR